MQSSEDNGKCSLEKGMGNFVQKREWEMQPRKENLEIQSGEENAKCSLFQLKEW